MRRYYITLLVALCALACTDPNEKEIFEGVGLGLPETDYVVDAEAGNVHVDVISNATYSVSSQADWVSVPTQAKGREGFEVSYTENAGAARIAQICVSLSDSMKDTLYLRQKGAYVPEVDFEAGSSLVLDGSAAGSAQYNITTNLADEEISMSLVQDADKEVWISDIRLDDSVISFNYEANSGDDMRITRIHLNYVDEYGYETYKTLFVTQKNQADDMVAPVSLSQLRSSAGAAEMVENDLIIEGIVVSNKESGNMGDNTQYSIINIDYSVCQRTVYLESEDGSCGVMLLTESEEDNVFAQFDKVSLSLKGCVLSKVDVPGTDRQGRPVSYCRVDGLTVDNIISVEKGTGAPLKEKHIKDLGPDDIFTYVTLKDCELPFRKGSLTPVNEKLTNASNIGKTNKFPVSIHDREGSSIYVFTNTTCPYRRDGSRLPYGSGDMKGIVVYELFSRFIYQDNNSGDEDSYGNLGWYQLRHTCREDFAMAKDRSDSDFSAILAEWRYILGASQEKYYATDGDKTAYFTHSAKHSITLYDDFSYLGPVGTSEDGFFGKNAGNRNGLGVILENGVDWMGPDYVGQNSENAFKVNNTSNGEGAGISPSNIGAAWHTNVNWDTSKKIPAGLVLNFSTRNISSDKMSLHLALMSVISNGGLTGPRQFNVDWSLDNATWTKAGSFTISDYGGATGVPATQLWQTPGYIPVTVELPASELCGKETVYVRIFPDESMRIGSYTEYITSKVPTNSYPRTAYNYIGIRYNK